MANAAGGHAFIAWQEVQKTRWEAPLPLATISFITVSLTLRVKKTQSVGIYLFVLCIVGSRLRLSPLRNGRGHFNAGALRVRDRARVMHKEVLMEAQCATHIGGGIMRVQPATLACTLLLRSGPAYTRASVSWGLDLVADRYPRGMIYIHQPGSRELYSADTADQDAPVQRSTDVYNTATHMGDAHCSPLPCHCRDLRV